MAPSLRENDRWLIPLLVLLVFASKAAFWPLPYHWDETVAYMPAVHWLTHQPLWRTLPGCHPLGQFYGHPPLLFLLLAGIQKIAGESPILAHALITAFSALGIIYIYLLGKHLWGTAAGLSAALLTFFTPTWFSQSAMVLGDLPIAAVGIMTIYYALRGNLKVYLICGIGLVLLKETAGTIILAILLYKIIFTSPRTWKISLWGLPLLILAAFFLVQKLATGSFLPNPYFDDTHPLLAFSLEQIGPQAHWLFRWTFAWHGRWLLLALILLGTLVAPRDLLRRETALFAILILLFTLAFSILYWMNRYMLPILPLLCLLAAGALVQLLRPALARLLVTVLLLCAFSTHYYGHSSSYYNYDDTLEYVDMIRLNQDAVDYLAQNHPNSRVRAVRPLNHLLAEPWQGYLAHPLTVVPPGADFDLLVYYEHPETNPAWDTRPLQSEIATGRLHLLHRFTRNGKWLEIYTR